MMMNGLSVQDYAAMRDIEHHKSKDQSIYTVGLLIVAAIVIAFFVWMFGIPFIHVKYAHIPETDITFRSDVFPAVKEINESIIAIIGQIAFSGSFPYYVRAYCAVLVILLPITGIMNVDDEFLTKNQWSKHRMYSDLVAVLVDNRGHYRRDHKKNE